MRCWSRWVSSTRSCVVEAFVMPGGVCLHAVVGWAQGCEVGWAGLARWSAVLEWEVFGDVVEVELGSRGGSRGRRSGHRAG